MIWRLSKGVIAAHFRDRIFETIGERDDIASIDDVIVADIGFDNVTVTRELKIHNVPLASGVPCNTLYLLRRGQPYERYNRLAPTGSRRRP